MLPTSNGGDIRRRQSVDRLRGIPRDSRSYDMNNGRTVLCGRGPRNLIRGALALFVTLAVCGAMSGTAAATAAFPTKACAALQAKYPGLKGKTLVDALNPHTPGYEALD